MPDSRSNTAFDREWDGWLTHATIDYVAERIKYELTGKRYTYIAVHDDREPDSPGFLTVRSDMCISSQRDDFKRYSYTTDNGGRMEALSFSDQHGIFSFSTPFADATAVWAGKAMMPQSRGLLNTTYIKPCDYFAFEIGEFGRRIRIIPGYLSIYFAHLVFSVQGTGWR